MDDRFQIHSHDPKEIKKRLSRLPKQSYLRDWIYGAVDGTVTTFAIVSGAVGGHLSYLVIIILGFANLIADGFSMAASNFLGTKSDADLYAHYRKIEEQHIAHFPEGEKQEIRQILENYHLPKKNIETITESVTENKSFWIELMLHEEYGLPKIVKSPYKAALNTLLAFVLCGFIPLAPYTFRINTHPFLISATLTLIAFFFIGASKCRWSIKPWWQSGLTTLFVGGLASFLAFLVGAGIKAMT